MRIWVNDVLILLASTAALGVISLFLPLKSLGAGHQFKLPICSSRPRPWDWAAVT
jgi:hypothetical protein